MNERRMSFIYATPIPLLSLSGCFWSGTILAFISNSTKLDSNVIYFQQIRSYSFQIINFSFLYLRMGQKEMSAGRERNKIQINRIIQHPPKFSLIC